MPLVKVAILLALLLFGAYANHQAEKRIEQCRKVQLRERNVIREKPFVEIGSFTIGNMKGQRSKKSMLEYCKIILTKMSFDKILFRKEYKKTFVYLNSEEHDKLKVWLRGHAD